MRREESVLSVIFGVAGVLHFLTPTPFERIIPRAIPAKRELVYASGVVELACAAGLRSDRTRGAAGWVAAGLLTVVFPANIEMWRQAQRSSRAPGWYRVGLLARLPLQAPLIAVAVRAARRSSR